MAAINTLPLHILVENILNDMVPETPREAVLARVAAGRARFAHDESEVTRQLTIARDCIVNQKPVNWRDALRANVDLGTHLYDLGDNAGALAAFQRAHHFLDTYFGCHNNGGYVLGALIAACA